MPMPGIPHVSHVVQAIQLSVAPVFLLAGVGSFLNVCAARLARVIDRARIVEEKITRSSGEEHDRLVAEIRTLDRRISIVNNCISLAVLSACLVCLVVTLLFANQIFAGRLDTPIALTFVSAMLSIGLAFALFIIETRLGSSVVRIRAEILFHKDDGRG
jgi:prepilin signal peptidase PulO-like enzyme (type II secretory pathway)